ncbi:MAG: hypothetical protein QXM52_01135 [Candidatus Bathyarchaeia archaeon]
MDARWVRSWVQLNDEEKIVKIYCEWNAKAAENICKIIEKVQLSLDGLHLMSVAESEDITLACV